MDFLKTKISTLAGVLILLTITAAVGYFIIYQFNEMNDIKFKAIERASEY